MEKHFLNAGFEWRIVSQAFQYDKTQGRNNPLGLDCRVGEKRLSRLVGSYEDWHVCHHDCLLWGLIPMSSPSNYLLWHCETIRVSCGWKFNQDFVTWVLGQHCQRLCDSLRLMTNIFHRGWWNCTLLCNWKNWLAFVRNKNLTFNHSLPSSFFVFLLYFFFLSFPYKNYLYLSKKVFHMNMVCYIHFLLF